MTKVKILTAFHNDVHTSIRVLEGMITEWIGSENIEVINISLSVYKSEDHNTWHYALIVYKEI
jgi:hypothetical protein